MSTETNPYLRRLEETSEAKKKWAESEWLLNFLRSDTGQKPRILKDEELLEWDQTLH